MAIAHTKTMAKKKKEKKSFVDDVWDTFSKTGDLGLYLLYKNLNDNNLK